jgi:hypothetical protein
LNDSSLNSSKNVTLIMARRKNRKKSKAVQKAIDAWNNAGEQAEKVKKKREKSEVKREGGNISLTSRSSVWTTNK